MSLAQAIAARDASALPSRRDEDWRWTDLRGLIRQVPPPSPKLERIIQPGGPFAGISTREHVIANGRLNWWPERDTAAVKTYVHDTPDPPQLANALPMAAWAAEDAEDPRVTIVSVRKDGAFSLRLVSDAHETSHHARIGVVVKKGVSAVMLESYEGSGSGYLANYLLEIFLEEGAGLERVVISDEAADAVLVSTADVRLERSARFRQTVLTEGSRRQRLETRVVNPGHGAFVRLDGVYLLDAARHADITTAVVHQGVGGETSQLTKGVAGGQSRGVFQGRITVAHGADKTDARMRHDALVLSDRAEVDAKPELEIYADDVACAHGNTVGALDAEALFYARQRGIPLALATAMLTEAFVAEAVDRIEHAPARDAARAWVAARLEGLQP